MSNKQTGRRWKVKSTAYFGTPGVEDATNEADRKKFALEGGSKTALGDRVGRGDIAVPKNVPLGTVLYIPGYGWGVARDHGGGIVGDRIDVATGGVVGGKVNPQAEKDAKQWGRKDQTVYVFPKGYQIPVDRSPPQEYLDDTKNAPIGNSGKQRVLQPAQNKRQPINVSEDPNTPVAPVAQMPQQPTTAMIQPHQSALSQQVAADAVAQEPLVRTTNFADLNPYVKLLRETDFAKKLSANFNPQYNQGIG